MPLTERRRAALFRRLTEVLNDEGRDGTEVRARALPVVRVGARFERGVHLVNREVTT